MYNVRKWRLRPSYRGILNRHLCGLPSRLVLLIVGLAFLFGCPTNPDLGNVGDLIDSGIPIRPGPDQVFVLVRNQSGLNAFARVSMRVNGIRVHLAERRLSPDRNLIILGPEETDSVTFEGFRGADVDPAKMQSTPIEVRERGREFNDGDVLEFIIPPIPDFGACCNYVDLVASCRLTTLADCSSTGGVFLGTGSNCTSAACPARGACCTPQASCLLLTSADCASAGGTFIGDDVGCTQVTCVVQPRPGACCLASGECASVIASECASQGGTFRGENAPCATADCPPPPPPPPATGACCLGTGECTSVIESVCASRGGTFRGQNAPCATANCPPPPPSSGACCLPSAVNCEVTTPQRCAELSGTYEGDDTVCEPSPCVPQSGACCLGGKGGVECYIKTRSDCEDNLGGYYAGDGSVCSVDNCGGPPLGACCLWSGGDSYCSLVVQNECEQSNGSYFGDWTNCAGVECVPPPGVGACCLPGGTQSVCILSFGGLCNKFGGVFFGPGSQCDMARCGVIDLWDTAEVDFHADAPFPRNNYRVYPRGGGDGEPGPLRDDATEPELVFDAPADGAPRVVGEPIHIGWAARDDDSNARIWILLDPAVEQPGDSIIVKSGVAEDDLSDRSATVESSNLAAGDYLLIGIISDGRTMKIVRGPMIRIGPAGETGGIEIEGR